MSDLVDVKRTPDDEDYVPPLPEAVIKFRSAINELKGSILESSTIGKSQDISGFVGAAYRIQEIGNSLKDILKSTDPEEDKKNRHPSGGGLADLKKYFEQNGISFEDLTSEERDLCLTYIKIDIDMHPYDLSIAHINSQYKSRGGFYER